jgi:hypothetical protein
VADCIPAICVPISSVALAVCEVLHLARHHGKPASSLTRPRRLDGGVEREQVGLLGDRRDQFHDITDAARGLRQLVDAGIGLLRLLHRLAGDLARLLHLTADLVDRRGHFLSGGRNRLDVR